MKTISSTIRQLSAAYLPVVFWAGIIFYLSSQTSLPSVNASLLDFIFKKGAHIFVYGVLYILMYRAILITSTPSQSRVRIWLPLIATLIYAATDEFHQSFIPGRFPTFRDIGYDALGMAIAFLRLYRYI